MFNVFSDDQVKVIHDPSTKSLVFSGEMRYPTLSDYKQIKGYLWSLIPTINKIGNLTINVESLEYLNSSGQAILNMFILELKRETVGTKIIIHGTKSYEWQEKFLYTTKQLWGDKSEPMEILFDGDVMLESIKRFNNIKAWI